jgi:MFS family permease
MTNMSGEEPTHAETRLSLGRLGGLTAYWVGLSIVWGSLTTIVLPRLVELAVPAAIKTTAISFVAGLQALVAIVVQPLSGAASDHLVTPWGRRRPLLALGVSVQIVLMLMLAMVQAYWVILAVMLCVEVASNLAQGPYQGLLPDLIPPGERGLGSGFLGAGNLAGQVVGVALSGLAIQAGAIPLAIVFCALSLAGGSLITILSVDETLGRSGRGVRHAVSWTRELLSPSRWVVPIRQTVLEVWGRDVLEHRDYLWLLASRLLVLMAAGTLQPFVYYYLEDAIGLGSAAGPLVAPLAGVVALVALASAIPGGAMTARWGGVRTVAVSATFGAVGAALFAVAPNYVSLFVIAVPFGLALGVFLSADWALLTDVAPLDQAGRYLGLSNTVTAGSAVLAVAISGPIADLVNSYRFGMGYRFVFVIAAVEFIIGVWCVLHVHEPSAGALRAAAETGPLEAHDASDRS